MGAFGKWQSAYAEAGLVTFPVDGDAKKPAVGNYLKAGAKASADWGRKFPDADAIGLTCGRRNRLTVLDIDAPDESLLADALARFGASPIVVRTASGKFHAWYRHNGEGRMIRTAMPGRPVDVLGNGFALAPPSCNSKGRYEFIQGGLADLVILPVMRSVGLVGAASMTATRRSDQHAQVGQRNNELWRACMAQAHSCPSKEQLRSYALAFNLANTAEPLPETEVARVVDSVWTKHLAGDNWMGSGRRLVLGHDEIDDLLTLGADAVALMLKLRREHYGRDSFLVANAMASAMSDGAWTEKRFSAARRKLVAGGHLIEVRPASMKHGPALYQFRGSRDGREGEAGGRGVVYYC